MAGSTGMRCRSNTLDGSTGQPKPKQMHVLYAYTDEDSQESTSMLSTSVDESDSSDTSIKYESKGETPSTEEEVIWHSRTGSKPSRRKSRWIIITLATVLIVLVCTLLTSHYQSGNAQLSALLKGLSRQCPDPYTLPGFLIHNSRSETAQWVPYTDAILDIEAQESPASLPSHRNEAEMPGEISVLSPPSFQTMLKEHAKSGAFQSTAAETAQGVDFELLRDKTVLLLGCSLDRYFMESFCRLHGAKFVNIKDDWHGMFRCTIPNINLQLQLWFTYGALPSHTSTKGEPRNFEDRVRDYWLPEAQKRNMTTEPDMIIWASGTWDVLGLRMRYAQRADWVEQAISWQELAWHRRRMREMMSFIREQWPGVPALYRSPTYLYKKDIPSQNGFLKGVRMSDLDKITESIYRVQQSADAVLQEENMPVFRWAEKLVGNNEFGDTMHYRPGSYAQWLYGDMLLYYLHHFSMSRPSHCLTNT